jgi:hypothetical protein
MFAEQAEQIANGQSKNGTFLPQGDGFRQVTAQLLLDLNDFCRF